MFIIVFYYVHHLTSSGTKESSINDFLFLAIGIRMMDLVRRRYSSVLIRFWKRKSIKCTFECTQVLGKNISWLHFNLWSIILIDAITFETFVMFSATSNMWMARRYSVAFVKLPNPGAMFLVIAVSGSLWYIHLNDLFPIEWIEPRKPKICEKCNHVSSFLLVLSLEVVCTFKFQYTYLLFCKLIVMIFSYSGGISHVSSPSSEVVASVPSVFCSVFFVFFLIISLPFSPHLIRTVAVVEHL